MYGHINARKPISIELYAYICFQCFLVRFSAAMQLFKCLLLIPLSALNFDCGLSVMNLIGRAEFGHGQCLRQTEKERSEL